MINSLRENRLKDSKNNYRLKNTPNHQIKIISKTILKSSNLLASIKISLDSNINKLPSLNKESLLSKTKIMFMIRFFTYKELSGYLTKSFCKSKITRKIFMISKLVSGIEFQMICSIRIGLIHSSSSSKISIKIIMH